MRKITGHTPVVRLTYKEGEREVWRTVYDGRPCVTRIVRGGHVTLAEAPTIRAIVLGRGSAVNLPEDVQLTIEGYRLAALLTATRLAAMQAPDRAGATGVGAAPRWPRVLDAGVTPDGFVYVTTEWMEGETLATILPVPDQLRVPIARGIGRLLEVMHDSNIAYGDLKGENLIIGPDGTVALIDLDTMREVPAPELAIRTRDLTASWAAPEQRGEQQTYLASDTWAYGRLVRQLFGEDIPEAWREMVSACAHPRPLDRPSTRTLVARLHDPEAPVANWHDEPVQPYIPGPGLPHETNGITQRVEELGAQPAKTERVAEPTTTQTTPTVNWGVHETTARAAKAGSSALRSCLLIPLVGSLLGVGTCVGLVTWWDRSQIAMANAAADDALSALKAYKTRPEVNKDTSQRSAIRVQADAAWEARATPHATAVRGLALVWEQGWQDASRKWDPQRYDDAIAALSGTADEPAAWMARATVEGGACRLNRTDALSAGHCDRALDAITSLNAALPDADDWRWLRVEASWTEVLVRGELAGQAIGAKTGEADQRLAAVLAACSAAAPHLPFGPVNAIELQQDCLGYAALAGDWPSYFVYADYLFDHDLAKDVVPRVYRAAGPGCEDTLVTLRRGDWVTKGAPWCTAVGNAARGCTSLAAGVIARSAGDYPEEGWEALSLALGNRTERCRE